MRRSMIGLTAGCVLACIVVAVPAITDGANTPVLGTGLALLCCSLTLIPVLVLRRRVQERRASRRALSGAAHGEPIQDQPLCG